MRQSQSTIEDIHRPIDVDKEPRGACARSFCAWGCRDLVGIAYQACEVERPWEEQKGRCIDLPFSEEDGEEKMMAYSPGTDTTSKTRGR